MRVVSLVPSITETLYELGVGGKLVGVTHFCVHPDEARLRATRVGGTKNPKIDLIRELKPDLVVANVEENRREDVEALEAAGVRVHATDVRDVAGAARFVREMGELFGRPREAEAMGLAIEAALDAAHAVAPDPPLAVFCPIWKDPWMVFNRDTFADSVLRVAGAENVFAPWPERYDEVSERDIREGRATHCLLPSEPYAFAERHRAEVAERFGFAPSNVALLDGEALTWWGARTASGLLEVARTVASLEGGLGAE